MTSIEQELRKPAHYLSMRKREQAANKIEALSSEIADLRELQAKHDTEVYELYKKVEHLNGGAYFVLPPPPKYQNVLLALLLLDEEQRNAKSPESIEIRAHLEEINRAWHELDPEFIPSQMRAVRQKPAQAASEAALSGLIYELGCVLNSDNEEEKLPPAVVNALQEYLDALDPRRSL